ncbi:MAG: hypothetical protein L6420_09015 [Elusimicrobia bacterium]|nr:hypothetical protein [Elusimicrobiota bacterium]
MNKWLILIIVVILAFLAALQIMQRKYYGHEKQTAQKAYVEPAGVSLPPDATDHIEALDAMTRDLTGLEDSDSPGLKNTKGVCKEGSLRDIMSSYGKIWGDADIGENYFLREDSEMYKLISSYFSCQAASSGDMRLCNSSTDPNIISLPRKILTPEDELDDKDRSLRGICRGMSSRVMFAGYMAGKHKDEGTCHAFITAEFMDMEDLSVPISDFCSVASNGMENICSSISKYLPANSLCLKTFPKNKKDCEGESSKICMDNLQIYKAIKNSRPKDCPEGYKEICEAFENHNSKSCEPIAKRLSFLYCENLQKYKKIMAEREKIKQAKEKEKEFEKIKQAQEKKRELETIKQKQKQEREKELKEINKRVKKILGRED